MSDNGLDRDELLKDSEATLREVAGILFELNDDWPSGPEGLPTMGGEGREEDGVGRTLGLEAVLAKATEEAREVLDEIRRGRDVARSSPSSAVPSTPGGSGVPPAGTTVTTTGMLDGLDRAHSFVDQLVPADAEDALGQDDQTRVGEQLREELHRLGDLLHFQDSATHRLTLVSEALARAEARLEGLARLFDLHRVRGAAEAIEMVVDTTLARNDGFSDPETP